MSDEYDRVRKNASPRQTAKSRATKTHLAEWQRTLCGLRISEVSFEAVVGRPSKVTCGGCKRVLANRRKRA